MKVELELGIFKGFYNSFYESEIELNIESDLSELGVDYDAADIDYHFEDLAKSIFDFAKSEYYEELPFIKNMEFSELYSPKYYNYSNDKIYFNCGIDNNIFKDWLSELISDNESDLLDCIYSDIIETHTSCPGFTSFHSNKVKDWIKDLLKFDLSNKDTVYKIGFILTSFIENKARLEDYNYSFDYAYLDSRSGEIYLTYEIKETQL
jgi:hypothetical protein